MWIHVPSTSCQSALEWPVLNWGSTQPWMEELARSATWKTNSVSQASWRRVWKTVPSIRLLSGLTSPPSTQSRGVAEWISWLGASRASHIASQEASSKKTIPANSQERSLESPTGLDFQTSFLKMSPESSDSTGTPYDPNYEQWVTQLRRASSLRQRSAHRIVGNGSSSWPTPNAGPQNDSDTTWPQRREKLKEKWGNNGFGLTLGMAAANWPTPTGRDYKDGTSAETVPENGLLVRAAPNWENSRSSPQAPTTEKDGGGSSPDGPNSHQPTAEKGTMCSPKCRRLSPTFCEALMGLPPGWTDDSAPLATGLYQQWRRRLIESLRP